MFDQLFVHPIWELTYLNNTLRDYLVALVVFLLLFLVLRIILAAVLTRLRKFTQKSKNDLDDILLAMLSSIKPRYFVYVSFWAALRYLTLHEYLIQFLNALLILWSVAVVVKASSVFIDFIIQKQVSENGSSPMAGLLRQLFMGAMWLLGILMVLSNLGVNVTSLIAGLGIGGVAVALAAQNILEDLFSSFAIYFDKPFEVGDFIQIGNDSGTVKKIGIKTTRLRSLQGEEIVVSNKELTSSRINNFRRIKNRDVFFKVGVTYDTPQKKLQAIPELFEQSLEGIDLIKFNRAHLVEFADSAIIYELSYNLASDEFVDYLDRHQEILLRLNELFTKQKIEFAYPTQTIHVQK